MLEMFKRCNHVGEIKKGNKTFGVYVTKSEPLIVHLEFEGKLASKEDIKNLSSDTPYKVETSLFVKIDDKIVSLLTKDGKVFRQ